MTHATWPDGADVLARVGRHWDWMMTFGVISLLAGVAVLAWPGRTLIVVAVLFGIQLVVTGIFRFVAAFASEDLTGGTRVLLVVLGVLSLVIGLYAVRHVLVTLLALALLLGIYWIINGAVELFMALSARGVPGRGGTGVMGAISVVAGLLVLVYPKTDNWTRSEEAAMPVMGFTKFERFFRAAGGVSVDRDDVKRYLDFVNDAIYDLLIIGQATAKANVRDVIEPWDLPITKGLQESTHAFQRLEEEIELRPILESLTARPPLDATLDEETEARLPLLFGGISVALARTFKLIDAELKAVHSEEWERTFSLFRLLI
jgi:uncharacterized membrane protein HdeD (DUF308 family)